MSCNYSLYFLLFSVPQDEKLLRWKYVMIFLLGNTLACVVCAVFLNINDRRKVGSTLLQVELQLASSFCWFIIVMFIVCCCLYTKYRLLTVQYRDHWMKFRFIKHLYLYTTAIKSCILEIFFINFSQRQAICKYCSFVGTYNNSHISMVDIFHTFQCTCIRQSTGVINLWASMGVFCPLLSREHEAKQFDFFCYFYLFCREEYWT